MYLLKNKFEVFGCFKKFKAFVENESDYYLKSLRLNRGDKLMSKDFIRFCEEHGIKRQLTAPYSPQHNGLAEKMNKTIFNMVQNMLNTKNLPK